MIFIKYFFVWTWTCQNLTRHLASLIGEVGVVYSSTVAFSDLALKQKWNADAFIASGARLKRLARSLSKMNPYKWDWYKKCLLMVLRQIEHLKWQIPSWLSYCATTSINKLANIFFLTNMWIISIQILRIQRQVSTIIFTALINLFWPSRWSSG